MPKVYGSGISVVGPYIAMLFLEGELLSELLKDLSVEGRPELSDRSLRRAYYEMAVIMLQLSRFEFDAIGALTENNSQFSVGRRPLTLNINELMALANLPKKTFPSQTFQSGMEYFKLLVLQQLAHLQLQQNDIIWNQEDCKRNFTVCCLFLNIMDNIFTE